MNNYHVTQWCSTCGKAKGYTTVVGASSPTSTTGNTTMPDLCTCWMIQPSVNAASVPYYYDPLKPPIDVSAECYLKAIVAPPSLEDIRQIVREELAKMFPE